MNYILEVKLLSEAIFGSGNSVSGVVDQEVLHDDLVFPFMKGKTVKGKFKEEFAHILWCLSGGKRGMEDYLVREFFGGPDIEAKALLSFSDLCMDKYLRGLFDRKVQEHMITPEEILNAVTEIRTFTAIDYNTGVADKGTLRKVRVIRKGFRFSSQISVSRNLEPWERDLLCASALSLKYLGTMETRGKGKVSCRLLDEKFNPITLDCNKSWEKLRNEISVL